MSETGMEALRDTLAGHPIGGGYYGTTVGTDEAAEMADAVRDYLLSDEAVERAARAMDENFNPDKYPIMAAMYRDMARVALAAALGEDETDE